MHQQQGPYTHWKSITDSYKWAHIVRGKADSLFHNITPCCADSPLRQHTECRTSQVFQHILCKLQPIVPSGHPMVYGCFTRFIYLHFIYFSFFLNGGLDLVSGDQILTHRQLCGSQSLLIVISLSLQCSGFRERLYGANSTRFILFPLSSCCCLSSLCIL